jgi:sarcosine oxidase subunit gamma
MADIAHANRIEPLSGRVGGAAGVSLTPAGAAYRVSLRVDPAAAKTLSKKLGLELPMTPKTSVHNDKGRLAAWLGPDEWLIIDENADPLKDLEKTTTLHSAVDISHRNTAVLVSGNGARATVQSGCPQNLSDRVFPVGSATRTVMGKIEVVIIRTGEDDYRVECWRSFSDYAFTLLSEAARDCLA